MNNKISVVIPVYNVEKYIKECLDSVINQTYKNLQIILVDDGSTDNSGEICDEYASKDNRITVIHQENQGAGAAKNSGIELATGEYLSLIDSDDYIELNYYETLLSVMKNYNADVVQCLFYNVFVNKSHKRNYNFPSPKNRKLRTKQFLFEMLYDWKYAVFWNKLFKTELLKNNRFPFGRKIDDEFFTYKLICNAKSIVNINDSLYNYRMRNSSVMNEESKSRLIRDRIDCFEERHNYVSNLFPKLNKDFYNHFSNYLLYNKNNCKDSNMIAILDKYIEKYPIVRENILEKIIRKIKFNKFISDSTILNGEYFL
jgi:glycosyltransferase involved in cell wall biosynthesis